VILLSGIRISGEDQAAGLSMGLADGYIPRPFSRTEFLARIEAMLRLRSKQESLREALRLIAHRIPGLVCQYRLRPNGKFCIPFANEVIRQYFQLSPEEVREDASKLFATLHPEDFDEVVASLRQSATNLTPWVQEFRVQYDDGTMR